ncbi:MAG: hypothetical protein OHK0048_10320 [Rhodoferax sp.]
MSIGSSGRIVIEIDPIVKRHLYAAPTRDGVSLKEWFLNNAHTYLASANQLPLFLSTNEPIANMKNIADFIGE